jgi:hypothetical protein
MFPKLSVYQLDPSAAHTVDDEAGWVHKQCRTNDHHFVPVAPTGSAARQPAESGFHTTLHSSGGGHSPQVFRLSEERRAETTRLEGRGKHSRPADLPSAIGE